MANELSMGGKLILPGLLFLWLPILTGFILVVMVRSGWVLLGSNAVNIVALGILLPISLFGFALLMAGLYIDRTERD